jgi:hypothetical protein
MNKRLDIAAKVLMGHDISDNEGDFAGDNVKTLAEYRQEAATVLVTCDTFMLAPEVVTAAIERAGYQATDYLEPFLKIVAELNQTEVEAKFFLNDMYLAWARGHEDGFWDGRQTDATKPSSVKTPENTVFFTEEDVKTAEAQGYLSGWENGVLSTSSLSEEASHVLLFGAEHARANNPYTSKTIDEGDN